MSRMTQEINKISITVIGIAGKVLFLVLAAVLLMTGARKGYEFGHSIFYSPGMETEPGRDVPVSLTGEESLGEVGVILRKKGLIRDDSAFAIQALCYEYKVEPGSFTLNTSMSSKEIILDLKEKAAETETAGEAETEPEDKTEPETEPGESTDDNE